MIRLSTTEMQIIKVLAKSNGKLHHYTFYKRIQIHPGALVKALKKLESHKFINVEDSNVQLLDAANEWLFANRSELLSGGEHSWRKVPDEVVAPQISINSPYIPLISRLDKSLCPKEADQKFVNGVEGSESSS